MKLSDLTPNPGNPRKITDEKKSMLAKALKEFGDISGVVFNRKTQRLIGGHQRRSQFNPADPIVIVKKYSKPTKTGTVAEGYIETSAGRFSYREVYWDQAKEKAAALAANKLAGEWDPAKLGEWIKELNSFDVDFDLDLTMFDPGEIKDIVGIEVQGYTRTTSEATGVDEDEIPEKPPAQTQPGDLYLLGGHRLLCGDSTDINQVDHLMDGQRAEMLFTDPPYGVDYSGGIQFQKDGSAKRNNRERLANDGDASIYSRVMPIIANHVDGPCYTWFAFTKCRVTIEAIEAIGEMHALIIWHKINATYAAMNAQYKQRHEPCIYWKPKGSTLRWCGPSDERTIWEIKRDPRNDMHPTQKPVELAERAMLNHSASIVLDLFGGSGSTLIAAEKTARKCYMMELDPGYCDVIVARWEKYTGLKAKRVRAETKTRKTAVQPRSSHAPVS